MNDKIKFDTKTINVIKDGLPKPAVVEAQNGVIDLSKKFTIHLDKFTSDKYKQVHLLIIAHPGTLTHYVTFTYDKDASYDAEFNNSTLDPPFTQAATIVEVLAWLSPVEGTIADGIEAERTYTFING